MTIAQLFDLRAIRRSLGTRRTRREGTKTKCLKRHLGLQGKKRSEYRFPQIGRVKLRPATLVRQEIRRMIRQVA